MALVFVGCGGSEETQESPLVCGPPPTAEGAPFIDVTASLGIDVSHHFASDFCEITDSVGGPGVCLFDFDGDDDLDIFTVDRAPFSNHLLRNDGATFSEVSEASGITAGFDSMGCLAFDADGDGDLDLYLSNNGDDALLRNDGGVFVDVTAEAGIVAPNMSASATAGDIDGDGDLDLFVTRLVEPGSCPPQCHLLPIACPAQRNLLFVNQGDGTFVEDGAARGLAHEEPSLATVFFDFDDDRDLDLYVGNDMGVVYPDRLYINDGHGTFVDEAPRWGFEAWGTDTMGVDVGDFDDDPLFELAMSDFKDKPLRILDCYDRDYPCSFEDPGVDSVEDVKWAVFFDDFDNDADEDLFWTAGDVYYRDGEPSHLYWNDDGVFHAYVPTAEEALAKSSIGRGAAVGDLDGDGARDVVIASAGGSLRVFHNQAAKGHGLTVALDSMSAGALVTLTTARGVQRAQALVGGGYLGSSDPRVFFGLGDACGGDVSVTWVDGATVTLPRVLGDQVLSVSHP